uniref:Putative pheromone receptor protein isoform s3 n=2 Tax=Flammulina TaxID=38944 RepID=A0A6C0N0T8_9AGAR|nr:putative pheromone receptor [Flammulina velutipes]QHW03269.1 putative pheromone receptor protein isoform s3 [Flammulina filiformis]
MAGAPGDNYPPNEVFTAFAFVGFILCVIPLPWHLQAWNVGTCSYMFWVGLGCFNAFVNSIVWNHNAINWSPVWCDISSRILVAENVAIAICSLTINRRLFFIATSDSVISSRKERRRAIITDLSLCFGVPLLHMIISIVCQGNRFQIFEDYGCAPSIYATWVSIVLFNVPPLLIGIISGFYSIRTVLAFNRRRLMFKEMLSAHSNLNSSRYFRLMIMAATDVVCVVPIASVVLWLNTVGIQPWISWANVHEDFMRVDQFPAALWHNAGASGVALELQRWFNVISALLFFGLFGFAEESRRNYMSALSSVVTKIGVSSSFFSGSSTIGSSKYGSSNSNANSLPVFVKKQVSRKRDSIESFTDMSLSQSSEMMKEKSFAGDISFDTLSFADVGGALEDSKDFPEPPSTSSISHSTMIPQPHPSEQLDLDIEISSIRNSIVPPPPALDLLKPPHDIV